MSRAFGRDEMNALIGGPAKGGGANEMAAFRQSGEQRNPHQSSRRTTAKEVDISKMTAAETAKLLSEKANKSGSISSTSRYRSKNKVLAHHQLLVEELSKQQQHQHKTTAAYKIFSKQNYTDDDTDNDDNDSEFMREKRPVQAAVVISRRSSTIERQRRRRRSNSSSSSSSSRNDVGNQKRARRNERNKNNRRDRRQKVDESSSSSSSDEEDDMRRNQRVLASQRMQEEIETIVPGLKAQLDAKESTKIKEKSVYAKEKVAYHQNERKQEQQPQVERMISKSRELIGASRTMRSSDDDDDDDDEESDSSSSSSCDSSSSSSEEEEPVRLKPIFVPRFKSNLKQSEEKKMKEEELKLQLDKERNVKRKSESRALVAKELVSIESSFQNDIDDNHDEECGVAINAPPNDDDDLDKEKERSSWEIRELERLLKSINEQEVRRKEEEEYSRRKKLTDAECLKEDIESGRYQAPGASRDKNSANESSNSNHLNRFFHRGAYYMDESEWDKGDIRQKAVEYAAAATGEDKIDKSKLPEVMKVKRFGRARQNTKYKGLSKEDTTDKSARVLPLRIEHRSKR